MNINVGLDEKSTLTLNVTGTEEEVFLGICYLVKGFCKHYNVSTDDVLKSLKQSQDVIDIGVQVMEDEEV